jgi:hypothetical protein
MLVREDGSTSLLGIGKEKEAFRLGPAASKTVKA